MGLYLILHSSDLVVHKGPWGGGDTSVIWDMGTPVIRDMGTPVIRDMGTPVIRDMGTPVIRDMGTPVIWDMGTPVSTPPPPPPFMSIYWHPAAGVATRVFIFRNKLQNYIISSPTSCWITKTITEGSNWPPPPPPPPPHPHTWGIHWIIFDITICSKMPWRN